MSLLDVSKDALLHLLSFCDSESVRLLTMTCSDIWSMRKKLLCNKLLQFLKIRSPALDFLYDDEDEAMVQVYKNYEAFQANHLPEFSSLCKWTACIFGEGLIPCKEYCEKGISNNIEGKLKLVLRTYLSNKYEFNKEIVKFVEFETSPRPLNLSCNVGELGTYLNCICKKCSDEGNLVITRFTNAKSTLMRPMYDSNFSSLKQCILTSSLVIFDNIEDKFVLTLGMIRTLAQRLPGDFKSPKTIRFLNCEGHIIIRDSNSFTDLPNITNKIEVINSPNVIVQTVKNYKVAKQRNLNNKELIF